jgi:hypothetical protein
MEATSRRMACESVTTCSVAMASGSASRMATSVMARAVRRISCARRISMAVTKKNSTGPRPAMAIMTRSCGVAAARPVA